MSLKQRVSEWEKDSRQINYHMLQWDIPKQSTLAFERFINKNLSKSKNVIVIGAGAGAATSFFAKLHASVLFTSFDYSEELTRIGEIIASEKGIKNLTFKKGRLD